MGTDGITDLSRLLAEMRPTLDPDAFVFCCIAPDNPAASLAASAQGMFREEEGLTLILRKPVADRAGLAHGPVMRMITLNVHSALEAVGLTAAVATALTQANISANVVAAYYHDHLFIPGADANRALQVLRQLAKA
ncbi:ACT domain-containing protein [Pararhizobium antarcticum]|uniref:Transporter n=1 Tax=Pararhizobium antarcticum TaxID=1798805 RepID=A0A657LSM8_9HYPH|nr:ACT domain-containing protein [Pararhizobium antarcticum]OJF90237.1 transporter [Rhizobium sp. 58]OJF95615.1 transporter [Pararhizobium antarcticum]